MLKKRYLFLILIICLFAISAVSATDNATNDIVSAEETTDEVVSVEDNQAILKENNNVGTFTDLVNEIANAGNELNLTMNYTYTDEDSNYKGGIDIYKSIVINGNGYTINGNNQARALKIHAPNVVLNNICFMNSYNIDGGGAIYWEEDNGALYNCSFINSSCGAIDWKDISCDGGAVYWYGNNGTVSGCSFVNCSAFGSDSASTGIRYWARGGAISWRGDDGILSDCSFVNSTCCGYYEMQSLYRCEGGAVYWTGKNGVLSSCSFINSFASEETSGAIHWGGVNGILSECSFINSTCGAIYWVGAYGILSDSSFYNCSVDDGCIIFWQGINGLINKSYFSQNFGSISGRSDLKIIKLYSSSLSCENSSFYYNDNVNLSASLNTCGKVIFDIFNEYDIKSFIVNTTNDGIAILSNELNELNAGLWNVTVIYEGNDNYCPSNATATITILPANSSLTIDDVNTTWDQQTTFTANVMSDDKLINDGFVSFYIDDKFIGNASVINGSANLIYELGDAGNHILTAVYNGNNYLSSNNSAKLFVDTGDIEVDDYDSVATFKSLAKLIEETPKGSTLNLIKDYYYVSGSNEGIQINKAITIDGQGHTLDGNQLSRIFYICSDKVILKNISFINGYAKMNGGISYIKNYFNIDFVNCSFINAYSKNNGGALYVSDSGVDFVNCSFINNDALESGGAIFWTTNDGIINACKFLSNSSSSSNALYIYDDFNEISNSFFENSLITCFRSNKGTINKCTFNPDFDNLHFYESKNILVIKNCVTINVTDYINIYSEFSNYVIELKDYNDLYLKNKEITFSLVNNHESVIFTRFTDDNGDINISDMISSLNVGAWNITVIFAGNDNYYPCNTTATITVLPAISSLTIDDINATVAHETRLIANVTSNLTINEGYVSFYDDEKFIGESQVRNGIATLTYTPTSDGEHSITAIFNSDNYLTSNATARLFVDSANVEVLVNSGTVGFNSTFIANVKGLYSIINEGNVEFYIDDNKIATVPVVNGSASLTYLPLTAGNFDVKVIYCDSDKFVDAENSKSYAVSKADSEISISDSYVIIANQVILTADISSSNNLIINEGSVTFFDDEINIGQANVNNGIASLTYTPMSDGEHQITTIFTGDNYLGSNATAKLFVDSASVEIRVNDTTVGFNNTVIVNVNALYSNVSDGTVSFINFGTSVSLVNGVARFTFVPLVAGDYYIDVEFANSDFSPEYVHTQRAFYHVFKADTKIDIDDFDATVGYETTLTVNLSSSNNLTINEGSVEFYMDDSFIGESNVYNGLSSLRFTPQNSGNHKITAVFKESDNYIASSNNSGLFVNKADTLISIEDISAEYYSNQIIFWVNISSNSNNINEGIVKFYVNNGEVGSVNVENGAAALSYVAPSVGNYDLKAVFCESDNYLSSNATISFEVIKMPTTLSGNSVIFDDDDTKTYATVLLDDNNNGVSNKNVEITVIKYSGEYSTFNAVTDSNGISTYDINSLTGGMWYISASFDGDDNYIDSGFIDKFIVVKVETTTDIEEISNPRVNHTYKLKANIHDENGKLVKEGIVQFYLDGVDIGSIDLSKHGSNQKSNNGLLGLSNPMFEYTLGVDDEEAYLEYTPTAAGNFTLFAVYEGTTIYKSSASATDFIVKESWKNTTELITSDVTTVYKGNEELIVTLMDDDAGKAIANADLTVSLNNVNYNLKTDSAGKASLAIPSNLSPKVYTAAISYAGNEAYESSNATAKIVVNKAGTVISAPDVSLAYKDSSGELVIAITSENGKPLVVNLNIDFNGESYTVRTDSNGQASIPIGTLSPGTYSATVSYKGSGNYKASNATAKVTVTKANTIIFAPDVSLAYKDSSGELVATIINEHGKTLVVNLNVNLNGKDYTVRTDSNGQAHIQVGTLSPGKYAATISYKGSTNYKASSTTAKVTVAKAATIISAPDVSFAYKDPSGELVATIVNEHGKPLVVNLNVELNGKTYSVKTDSNGQASIPVGTLSPGTYSATVSYKGSVNYKASAATAKVTVIKAETIISASDVSIAYKDSDGALVVSIVSEHGKALVVTLNVNLNGKDYSVRTDSNGEAIIPVGTLSPGKYTAIISYKGSANYKASTAMAKVTVTKADTIISAPDVSVAYKDPNGELVATIVNEHGKPLVVTLNVELNGKTYSVKTDSNGQASIPLGTLTPGTYTATISYKGSANYKASSTTAKVTVTKAGTIITAPDVSVAYGDPNGKLVSTITNEHGKPLVVNLNVELNGKTYKVKSDSNGQISVSTADLAPGTYEAAISYNGSSNYKASSTTANIQVK